MKIKLKEPLKAYFLASLAADRQNSFRMNDDFCTFYIWKIKKVPPVFLFSVKRDEFFLLNRERFGNLK